MKFLAILLGILQVFQHPAVQSTRLSEGSTTFILVRHAEKERAGSDPELSAEGRQRAADLSMMLRKMQIDAIYSTPFKRTKQTVMPLAKAKDLPIIEYSASMPYDQFIDELSAKHPNKVVVIAGHSNTIPEILKVLSKGSFSISIEDGEYDNLFVVTCSTEPNPSIIHLKYGNQLQTQSSN